MKKLLIIISPLCIILVVPLWVSLELEAVLTLFSAVLFAVILAFGFVKWMKFVDKHKRLIMAHLIDKDTLIAKIKHHMQFTPEHTNAFIEGEEHAYRTILSFLDTLEVKEVDLEKEYNDFIKSDNGRSMFETAKYFFELGLKARIDKETD